MSITTAKRGLSPFQRGEQSPVLAEGVEEVGAVAELQDEVCDQFDGDEGEPSAGGQENGDNPRFSVLDVPRR